MRFSTLTFVAVTLLVSIAAQPARADDVQTHLQKAEAAATQKDWDTALAELDAAIALDKNNIQAFFGRAMMLLQKQDVKGAIVALDRVVEIDAKSAAAYKMRASLYQQSGDAAKAQADLIAFLRLSPDESAKFQARAQAATDKKDWKLAVNLWSMLAQVWPGDARVSYNRGVALEGLMPDVILGNLGNDHGDENIAKLKAATVASYEAAVKADPKLAAAYIALGRLEVENAISRGLKEMPDNVELLVADANSYLTGNGNIFFLVGANPAERDKFLQPAFKQLNHALQLDPQNAAAFATRADVYKFNDQIDLALGDSATALKLAPNNVVALKLQGEIYGNLLFPQHNFALAADAYERLLAIDPTDSEVRYKQYLALAQLPEKPRALALINKMIEEEPHSTRYMLDRAELYFEQKDFVRALDDVNKILEFDPKNHELYLKDNQKQARELRDKIVAAQK